MRISEITYQTDISQLLDYDKLCADFEDCNQKVTAISEVIISQVSNCIEKEGGLDPDSFYIDEKPLLNQKAQDLKTNVITVLSEYQNIKAKILEEGKAHSEEELATYIKCLTDRIAIVEQELSSINSQLQELSKDVPNNFTKISELSVEKTKYENELSGNLLQKGLKMKLEQAKKRLK